MTTTTGESPQQVDGLNRKDLKPSSALRIHISCDSSGHYHHQQPHHRNSTKAVTKQPSGAPGGGGGSVNTGSPPSPVLATNFHTIHPSAKYHPLARHAQKPLSTYTTLGTPIPRVIIEGGGGGANRGGGGRPRSLSLGSSSFAAFNHNTICGHHHNNNNNTANGNSALTHQQQHDLLHAELLLSAPPAAPTPPRLAARRQAEASERARTTALEQGEVHCDADELRCILHRERARMGHIQAELTELRSGIAQEQLQAEVLEEECINGLVVRLDHLQEEKARIVLEEQEQEMVRGGTKPARRMRGLHRLKSNFFFLQKCLLVLLDRSGILCNTDRKRSAPAPGRNESPATRSRSSSRRRRAPAPCVTDQDPFSSYGRIIIEQGRQK
jgi:hypothetical protein